MSARPVFVLVAGGSGSGKSLWVSQNRHLVLPNHYDADAVARGFRLPNHPQALGRAFEEVDRTVEAHLRKKKSFSLENTYSRTASIQAVEKAYESGYRVRVYFLGTLDPAVNIHRVRSRAAAGGHPVPSDGIRNSHRKSVSNLVRTWDLFDEVFLIDSDRADPIVSARCSKEHPGANRVSEQAPAWVRRILDAVECPVGTGLESGIESSSDPGSGLPEP